MSSILLYQKSLFMTLKHPNILRCDPDNSFSDVISGDMNIYTRGLLSCLCYLHANNVCHGNVSILSIRFDRKSSMAYLHDFRQGGTVEQDTEDILKLLNQMNIYVSKAKCSIVECHRRLYNKSIYPLVITIPSIVPYIHISGHITNDIRSDLMGTMANIYMNHRLDINLFNRTVAISDQYLSHVYTYISTETYLSLTYTFIYLSTFTPHLRRFAQEDVINDVCNTLSHNLVCDSEAGSMDDMLEEGDSTIHNYMTTATFTYFKVNKYIFIRQVSQGSYGSVSEVIDRNGNLFCMKTSLGKLCNASIQNELYLLSLIDSPHVIKVLDNGKTEGMVWYIMKRYAMDMTTFIHTVAYTDRIETYIGQLLEGMTAITKASIIHRDVKTDNILYDPIDDVLVYCDFGMSIQADGVAVYDRGSLWTSSPESLQGDQITHAYDIWSLACVIYTLYSGKTLFTGSNDQDHLKQILSYNDTQDMPKSPLLKKMLIVNPRDRPIITDLSL